MTDNSDDIGQYNDNMQNPHTDFVAEPRLLLFSLVALACLVAAMKLYLRMQ